MRSPMPEFDGLSYLLASEVASLYTGAEIRTLVEIKGPSPFLAPKDGPEIPRPCWSLRLAWIFTPFPGVR